MSQNRLHQYRQRLSRAFGSLSRFSPRRVLRHFKAVSYRLDAIIRLIEAESAARIDQDSKSAALMRHQLAGLEQRLGELVSLRVAAAADHLASNQRAIAKELSSIVERSSDAVSTFKNVVDSWGLDRWKFQEYEGLLRNLRRQEYLRAIQDGRLAVPRLETEHPVAFYSDDGELPRGGKDDNAIARRFNHKLCSYLGKREGLRVLDLGCAGGGFVRSLIDDGHFAVGLEGSDYPLLLNQAAEWPTIPLHLFTCDITKPFRLADSLTNAPLLFDAITAWEAMENIPVESLPGLFENLDRHLAPGGLPALFDREFLDWDHQNGGCRARHRQTSIVVGKSIRRALASRLTNKHPFGKDDWPRGSGQCRRDWHEDQGWGFHIVLRKTALSVASSISGGAWRASVA